MGNDTRWYVYTGGDSFLNRIVSTRLEGEEISQGLKCSDGVLRDLWPCPDHSVVRELNKLNASDHLQLKFFVKEGPHGQVRPWNLENGTSKSNVVIRSRLQDFLRGHKKRRADLSTARTD